MMKLQSILSVVCLLVAGSIVVSCSKEDPGLAAQKQLALDIEKIETYITDKGLANVTTTSSGLRYAITEAGTGNLPEVSDIVVLHYEGKLLDGSTFDSSFDRGVPFTYVFGVGQVIPGFDEGVSKISQEGAGIIMIPSYLAYGTSGSGSIGANEVLIFNIEVWSDNEILENDLSKIENYIDTKAITGVEETSSGLNYVITKAGTGDNVKEGDAVEIMYRGYLLDGTVFDETTNSSYNYTVGQTGLIEGWEEAVALLNTGAEGTFFIPSKLGYGRSGNQGIAPNEVLIFDIEVVSIN
ncbi:MAG: FKBP-type peptidyl-prolyl cis-trans isomerase [Cyclobacteriaceae bacterium]